MAPYNRKKTGQGSQRAKNNPVSEKVKLGLIGTGHMGQYHVNVSVGLPDQYEVVGIYDLSEERRNDVASRFGVPGFADQDELIAQSDAVVVAVPTVLHYPVARKALMLGKHVLVEKPITQTVEEARELVDLADRNGLILQVGHVERFNGAVLELGKIVTQPLFIESRRLAPFNPRIKDVGVVLDLMIHDLDIIVNLVKSEVVDVYARGVAAFSEHEDIAVATLRFESGCIAVVNASRATQSKVRTLTISEQNAYIVLDFTTQDIDIHRQAASAYLMTREELKYKQESFVEKIFVHKDNPLRQEHLHFVNCIRGKAEPIVKGESDIRTLRIATEILAQVKSAVPVRTPVAG